MAGIYRKVDLHVWTDERVRRLSRPPPNGRDLWLYLLTAKESIIIPGVIPAGAGTISDTLDWTPAGLLKAFRELEEQGLAVADWKAKLVWIPKAIRYNPPAAPNVIRAWKDAWGIVPECPLRERVLADLKAYVATLHPGFFEAFVEVFKPSPQAIPPRLPPKASPEGMGEKHGGIQRAESSEQRSQDRKAAAAKSVGRRPNETAPPPPPEPERLVVGQAQRIWSDATTGTPLVAWRLAGDADASRVEELRTTPEAFGVACRTVARNRFLRGEKAGKHKGKPIGPGWLLNPKNFAAVLAGEYEADVPEAEQEPQEPPCARCAGPAGQGAMVGASGRHHRLCYACLGVLRALELPNPGAVSDWVEAAVQAPGPESAPVPLKRRAKAADPPAECSKCGLETDGDYRVNNDVLCAGCFDFAREAVRA